MLNTVVTFEEEQVEVDEMALRILGNQEAGLPWLVAQDESGQVIGYAYASAWKGRCAYRFSVEVTVYLAHDMSGKGWGSRLYEALFKALDDKGMHTVIGGIALPNAASIALHEKSGLKKVAHFEQVGFKMDRWVDVGYWQGQLKNGAAEP